MKIHVDNVDIDPQVRKGTPPVLVYPRQDGQTWHVVDSSILRDDTRWTLSRFGPRVRIPFIPYLVEQKSHAAGPIGLGARVCQVMSQKFPTPQASSAMLLLVGNTDCREPPIQEGYDRIWMAVAYVEEQ